MKIWKQGISIASVKAIVPNEKKEEERVSPHSHKTPTNTMPIKTTQCCARTTHP
jgi:hypothetical protein